MTDIQKQILSLLSERHGVEDICRRLGLSEQQLLLEVAHAFKSAGFDCLEEVDQTIESEGFNTVHPPPTDQGR